jgi:glycyl-tRNA synthetase beta subunit
MATIEEVKAAEKEMKEAQDALRAYVENAASGRDVKLHLRIATELKKATDKYFAAVLGLSSK